MIVFFNDQSQMCSVSHSVLQPTSKCSSLWLKQTPMLFDNSYHGIVLDK